MPPAVLRWATRWWMVRAKLVYLGSEPESEVDQQLDRRGFEDLLYKDVVLVAGRIRNGYRAGVGFEQRL
jgi:hypothetical protein